MRYVVAVAEERSFTRAADRCFVVQSALSHQIKALETELGVTLFARTSRRVELTTAGGAFLSAARTSLEAAERPVADAAAATGEVRGTLTIGMIPTVTAIDIPAALGEFHRTHPAVQIGLRGGGSDEFIAAITDGSIDVAVLGLPEATSLKGVTTRELARERLVAVVSADHPLAARSSCGS
ncbi:LysR family transcriptional regulator [Amycolatopsis sp. FDAARGOS 1241]|uniref:LysR family transcriptional regulator n=1 Tax=Amycolatopsis sp. FDAARGOS 1241 TaxID=2778070 RepID=UPI00351CAD7E